MSITFGCDVRRVGPSTDEPCLCAQRAPQWTHTMMTGRDLASLGKHADPDCPSCHGSGIERVPGDDPIEFNLCNDNARRLLEALGVPSRYELTMPEARRAIIRARNTSLDHLVRPEMVRKGKPYDRGDGVMVVQPTREFSPEFTVDDLAKRIALFERLVVEAARRGATRIFWG